MKLSVIPILSSSDLIEAFLQCGITKVIGCGSLELERSLRMFILV